MLATDRARQWEPRLTINFAGRRTLKEEEIKDLGFRVTCQPHSRRMP